MGFLNTDSMPRLVEKLSDGDNIKITGNSKGNRVRTVIKKIVEKAADVTKAIEQEVVNDGYSFKVGTGNVDVSTDVQDGFGEVGVKGVTYQNLLSCKKEVIVEGTRAWENGQVHSYLVKPNTKYTLFFEIESIEKGDYNFNPVIQTFSNNALILSQNTKPFSFQTNSDTEFITFRLLINGENASITNCKSIFKNLVLLEGNHTNNLNIPTYFEGIVGVGDKSKNLLNINTENHAHGVDFKFEKNVLKSSGIGSVSILQSFKITGLTIGKTYTISCDSDDVGVNSNGTILSLTPTNYRSFVFNDTESIYFQIRQDVDCTKEIKFLLEEGTKATSYEPYYDGHKIEILSNGKNLIDLVAISKQKTLLRRVKRGETYTFSYDYEGGATADSRLQLGTTVLLQEGSGEIDGGIDYNHCYSVIGRNSITLTSTIDGYLYLRLVRPNEIKSLVSNFQLEQNSTYSSYTPYQEDKTQILLDEPLMRLPNGVCDEITRDGKLIRRVGKVVLDGSEFYSLPFGHGNPNDNTMLFELSSSIIPRSNSKIINNHFVYYNWSELSGSSIVGVCRYNNNGAIIFRHNSNNLNSFKQWLSQNPTTVYYQLAEPIVTELPAPYLRIFKDGHLTFNTLVAPESNHVVQLNKSAQIERSIREVQSLDSRVGKLESFYDDMMLETNHKLSLLNYDFEYTRERNGE